MKLDVYTTYSIALMPWQNILVSQWEKSPIWHCILGAELTKTHWDSPFLLK